MSNELVRVPPSCGPRHRHDCQQCIFLGIVDHFDLYWCSQGGSMPTVIARASDEPSDYLSGWGSSMAVLMVAETLSRRSEAVMKAGMVIS
jgi:hypothetical protein